MEYSKSLMSVEGLKDLESALSGLPDVINKQAWNSIFGSALRKLIKPDLDAGLSPEVRKAVKIQAGKGDKFKEGRMIIGIGMDGFYQRFIEYGTKKRELKGRGKYPKGTNRGEMIEKPFIGLLYFSKMGDVIKYVEENAQELADKYLTKKLKKLNK